VGLGAQALAREEVRDHAHRQALAEARHVVEAARAQLLDQRDAAQQITELGEVRIEQIRRALELVQELALPLDRGLGTRELAGGCELGCVDERVGDALVRRADDHRTPVDPAADDAENLLDLAAVGDGAAAEFHHDHGDFLGPGRLSAGP
jgi:hypothetical protein